MPTVPLIKAYNINVRELLNLLEDKGLKATLEDMSGDKALVFFRSHWDPDRQA